MSIETRTSDSELQTVDCLCYRLRRAARLAAKTYDGALKPTGLRNTQFALLGTLNKLGESSIGELSEKLATDATTLTRNLKVLVGRGLIESVAADDARVHVIRVTELGKKTYLAALPLWRGAQKHMLDAIGSKRWAEMRAELDKIEQACA
ncbi:MAG: winged helix-turn-helix transcriptional regulator [Alphaproteobacteria bacterium]|nr:winged helix-turn-helix transcriptional regulator [Alphaproteobacteria bacterium]